MNPGTCVGEPDEDPVNTGARGTDSRMECRICWYIYDPAEGDPVGQVPPDTAFADLPDHWCCPRCDSDKSHFLPAM
ncbi:rubredoxin [Thiocapsa rosea]|uniref:Rubredoxin n=1 Tax=Thiocapsa rosea TaxID=69360 RepID=A0A495V4T8_9GAMM|nr:rubredoxin [Thiocapsa rosea]RKT42778.1 rubredoxin [Thiocapsa rosea]